MYFIKIFLYFCVVDDVRLSLSFTCKPAIFEKIQDKGNSVIFFFKGHFSYQKQTILNTKPYQITDYFLFRHFYKSIAFLPLLL